MNPSPPTLTLTERRPRRARLAPADVAFLLDRHRGHVEVLPTGRRHRYRLTATGHVGVIVAPVTRIVIRPKIPLRNLFFLLDPDADPPESPDSTTPEDGTAPLAFLARLFARRLGERLAAGLHRGYRERSARGPFLQGKLDLPAQLREAPGRRGELHSRLDDLTTDLPCNQALRAAGQRALASELLPDNARHALRHRLRDLEDITPLAPTPELWDSLEASRLPEGYRPLLGLARLLADGLAPGEQAGPTPAPAFLLDLERAFEGYLTRGFEHAPRHTTATAQPTFAIPPARPGDPDVHLRPDILLTRGGKVSAVVDAKWKRLPGSAVVTDDFYQVTTYAAALGARRAVLVYPAGRDRAWEYPLPLAGVTVEVRALRVTGPVEKCRRSLRRMVREVCRAG
jgi:5-methylcytosine-specific restriction enzyme subunit McrC